MHILIIIAAGTLIPIIALPFRLATSWVNVLVLLSAYCWISLHTVPHDDRELGWAIAILYFGSLSFLIGAIFMTRLCIRWYRCDPILSGSPPTVILKLVHACNGIFIALAVFAYTAHLFGGTGQAMISHLILLAIALAVLPMSRFAEVVGIYRLSTASALLMLTIASAFYPAIVHASARSEAKGMHYCIFPSYHQQPTNTYKHLTLLTSNKGMFGHGGQAILIVESVNGPTYGNWSYRRGRFMIPWDLYQPPTHLTCPH